MSRAPDILDSAPDRPATASAPREANSRVFWLVLLLTTLTGLAIRLYIGWKTYIDFDEWQHIFIASGARWEDVAFELQTNAHPPFFFLLLRGLSHFSPKNPLVYRSFSIAAGAGSIIVVGLIARKILDSRIVQLLCAAVFALSADAIGISVEIRSYQVAVFLALLAFLSLLAMFPATAERAEKWPFVTFAVCSSLAVSSHYSAIFVLGACALVSLMLPARRVRGSRWPFAAAMSVPFAVFAVEYFLHAGLQPPQGYLFSFYLGKTPGESAATFVLRNSRSFFNLFSPLEFRSTGVFLPFLLLLGVAAAWSLSTRLRASRASSASAILLAGVIVLEMLAASLVQKYPFGGLLRHEYIAGPFVLLAAFVVLDSLVSRTRGRLRHAIPPLLLAASVANLVAAVPPLIVFPGSVIMQEEFDAWQSAFPGPRAIYLDHWSALAYFVHTTDLPRTFARRVHDAAAIDEYRLPGGTAIFYDKTRISLDFADATVYRSLAACLRASRVEELSLFFFFPGEIPAGQTPNVVADLIRRNAAEQGLITTRVAAAGKYLFAGFRLDKPK